MGRVRGQFSEQERAAAIAAADARMWAEGMQAVGDVANGDSAFAVKSPQPPVVPYFRRSLRAAY